MGQINTDFIETLPIDKPNIFVETGTYLGGVPLMMLADKSFIKWNKIYTIELSEKCCKIASKRYELYEKLGLDHNFQENWSGDSDENFSDRKSYFNDKLTLLHGDSVNRLKDVLDEVDEQCSFWLDAHSGSKELFAKGEIDCPLIQELELISSHHIKDHFIAIDDVHLFGRTQNKNGEIICDYSTITRERVENIIKGININYTIKYTSPFGQLMLVAYVNPKDIVSATSSWWLK